MLHPDGIYVAVPYATVKPAMGGGTTVEIEPDHGKPYHFQFGAGPIHDVILNY